MAAQTKLQLCQAVARECNIAGGETVPLTTIGQTGELQRIVRWVEQSWREVQDRHTNWRWRRVGYTFNTTADDAIYSFGDATDDLTALPISTFSRWLFNDDEDPGKIFLTSGGVNTETWLVYADWSDFKSIYRIGTQTASHPIHVSIDPQDNLVLGPIPNDIYTVTGDFQRGEQSFTLDGDIPDMPGRFHDVIVYEAMKKYGFFESASEILDRADYEANRLTRSLEADQLPDLAMGEPMA